MNPPAENNAPTSLLATNNPKKLRQLGYDVQDAYGPLGSLSGTPGVGGALAPANGYDTQSSYGAGIGRWLNGNGLNAINQLGRGLWGNGALQGAVLTAGGLAALGYGGAKLWNLAADPTRQLNAGHVATLAGVLGAGGGGYLGGSYQKSAAAFRSLSPADIREAAVAAIAADRSLDSSQQSAAASAVQHLSGSELQELLHVLSTAGGAAMGVLIFRFLMGKGLIPMLLGAGAGALFGSRFGSAPTNAFGQRTFGPGGFFG